MFHFIKPFVMILVILIPTTALSQSAPASAAFYEIQVTNLTRGQIFSPIVAATHSRPFSLFSAGQAASPELAALAQDAVTDGLETLTAQAQGSREVIVADGPTPPGATTVLEIRAARARFLSLAAMLVTTNDAFIGLSGKPLGRRPQTLEVEAYDAGAENNDESCAFIPGPPCGNEGKASDVPGEGYIHVHSGIHEVGDLDSSFDWRNPVARITIRRIRK